MKTHRGGRIVSILMLVSVLMVCSLTPMVNSETISNECEVDQCFSTQFTLYNLDREITNYMYKIDDNWYDNITALELIEFVLTSEDIPYNTTTSATGTVFTSVNGTASNESWNWTFYLDRDGMWDEPGVLIDNALIKNIDNYAVALIPYAGGEHNPFQQSVGDWLEDTAVDEYIHSSGNVSSNGELVGSTWSDSEYSMVAWTVRTSGDLLGVNLTEIVMRVEGGEEEDELVSGMVLSNGTKNITHIYWWETIWGDVNGDGKFSVGDTWVVRTGQMGTHSGDYFVTFVRIGSCDWGWTASGCPDGQICSDGICTDEPEPEPEPEIDSDADGVVDYQDNCSDTSQGEAVNAEGCSETQLSETIEGGDEGKATSIPGFGIILCITALLGTALFASRLELT